MISITKEFNWPMGHRLENHKGGCDNLHGHNYKMFVTIVKKGNINKNNNKDAEGMIIDFSNIKNIINNRIIDLLDHAFAFNINDKDSVTIANVLIKTINQKVFSFDFRTTAENMSKWLLKSINDFLPEDIRCSKVILYETDTSYATYESSMNIA